MAGGQFVGEAVAVVGVAAPAGGVMPFLAVAGGVHVDGDDDGLLDGVANLAGEFVGSAYAFPQGDVFVGFYVGYTFDFKVQVFNQWSGGLDGFFAPVVFKFVQHQFQPGLLYRLYRCIGRQGHCIGGLFPADEPVGLLCKGLGIL